MIAQQHMVLASSFPHWRFFFGIVLFAATWGALKAYWRPSNEITRQRRRDRVLFRSHRGELIWLTAFTGGSLALSSGLMGGNEWMKVGLSDPIVRFAPTIGSITALGLFAVVLGLVFPVLAHRMHGYSGQASRLVLHISRFFYLEIFSLIVMFFVMAVHTRVVVCWKTRANFEFEWLQDYATYNIMDGFVLALLIAGLLHQFHSFVKRCADQLTVVQLVGRAGGRLKQLISWNADVHYKPEQIQDESHEHKNRRHLLPGYELLTEDQLLFALLVSDIGAVARRTAQDGDLWGTLKAIDTLDDLIRHIQESAAELRRSGHLVLTAVDSSVVKDPTTLVLGHEYNPQPNPLIQHIIQEIDQVVTIATTRGFTHILLEIIGRYEQRLIAAIQSVRAAHEADWCFFVLAQSRRFFYLQLTYKNPWLARRALEMLRNIAEVSIQEWRKHGFEIDQAEVRFYDCCLSHIFSSLRKFMSMAIVNGELSVLRVTVNITVQLAGLLAAARHPCVTRPFGSLVRMLYSGVMFAVERSCGEGIQILLDGIVRVLCSQQKLASVEINEIFTEAFEPCLCTAKQTGPRRARRTVVEIVESQLIVHGNPKLDLDHEDLLVNRDSLTTCAVAILDLLVPYAQLTGRATEAIPLILKRLIDDLNKTLTDSLPQRIAWLTRAGALSETLVCDSALKALEELRAMQKK